jgi:carboxypeptidase Taq
MTAYQELNNYIAEVNDILNTISILNWDARTQMPIGGTETRGKQLATLSAIAQERLASDQLQSLLDNAEREVSELPSDSPECRSVQAVRDASALFRRTPPELTRGLANLRSVAGKTWAEAKASNNFAHFAPDLEKMFALNRELAHAIGFVEHPYDAMLELYEPGQTAARLKKLFAHLRSSVVPLLQDIVGSEHKPRTDFLHRDYPIELQRQFALEVAQAFGFDLGRGRLDESLHPFEISFTRNDVRMTTRYNRNFLPMALFGVLHETGHALYEQYVAPELTRTALTSDLKGMYAVGGVSFGAHESQSRLWENLVGRSASFWQHWFPRLREVFPEQLKDVGDEEFYQAVNTVKPSLIRVEADEVTYNLHIMLRVEIEMGLLDGSMAVRDLPEIWNQKIKEYLGIMPPDDSRGVLQDIHWSHSNIGSFPCYTIGNIMGTQLFVAAQSQNKDLGNSLAWGNYAPLREWLTEHVYRYGRTYTPDELLVKATGKPLDVGPYLAYLKGKFSELYEL